MKKYILIFLVLIINFRLVSQLHSYTEKITFPLQVIKSTDSLSFYLKNSGNNLLHIKVLKYANSFSVKDSLLTINSHDSIKITCVYSPVQNVIDKGLIVFETIDSTSAFVILLEGSATTNDSYQTSTFNKFDSEMKSALANLVAGHTSLGYNTGRDRMFDTVDKQPGDTIECVYSGIKIKAANRTEAQNQNFDTEHTWPQSFFSQNEPMRSDLFHLYPTSTSANNARSNYPFGYVVSNITWQNGGSKLGKDIYGATVFEPRDVHKGDVARSMLYFVIRYTNYGNFLTTNFEQILKEWNSFDTVSTRELNRNTSIASFQLKRNPFIDHPEFINRIYSFATTNTQPIYSVLGAFPHYVVFDSIAIGDSLKSKITLINAGTKELIINSITSNNSQFEVRNIPQSILPSEKYDLEIIFKPTSANGVNGKLFLLSDGGSQEVSLSGNGFPPSFIYDNDITSSIKTFRLFQNYPNPFNPFTNISFQIFKDANINLIIYDVLGNAITTLIKNKYYKPGYYEVGFDASGLRSGIYFYSLKDGQKTSVMKMVILK